MARKVAVARKGGAPRKAAGGLDKVLYIRADQKLLDRLEELRSQKSAQHRIVLSTADVARSLLWEALDDEVDKEEHGDG